MKNTFLFISIFFILQANAQQRFLVGLDLGLGSSYSTQSKYDNFVKYELRRSTNISYTQLGAYFHYLITTRWSAGIQAGYSVYNYRFRDKEITGLNPQIASFEFVNRITAPTISVGTTYSYPLNDRLSVVPGFSFKLLFQQANSSTSEAYNYDTKFLNTTFNNSYGAYSETKGGLFMGIVPELSIAYSLSSKAKLLFGVSHQFGLSDHVEGGTYFRNNTLNIYLDKNEYSAKGSNTTFHTKYQRTITWKKKEKQPKPVAVAPENPETPVTDKKIDKPANPNGEAEMEYSKGIPASINGRDVLKNNQIKVYAKEIELYVWDNNQIDGDIISLYFNNKWIIQNYTLEKKKMKITLTIDPTSDNYLILYAISEGRLPTCTAELLINDGKQERVINIKSNIRNSGAIEFKYQDQ